MRSFKDVPQEISIVDDKGKPILANDVTRRFFEGCWVHKYNGKYYLSYSTGTTHLIVYAVSDDIRGPYVFQGRILNPVKGWTTHHSIVQFQDKWYLFYHDATLSGGVDYERSVNYAELTYNEDGTIQMINPYGDYRLSIKPTTAKLPYYFYGDFAYIVGITCRMRSRMIQYAPFSASAPPRLAGFLNTLFIHPLFRQAEISMGIKRHRKNPCFIGRQGFFLYGTLELISCGCLKWYQIKLSNKIEIMEIYNYTRYCMICRGISGMHNIHYMR